MTTQEETRNVLASLGGMWNDILTAQESGEKVVWISFNCSPEIFHALDINFVVIEILNTVAQNLDEGILPYLDLAVERGLPDSLCSGQRGVVGLLEAGLVKKPDILVNGAAGSCNTNLKIFEYISEKFDIPCLYLDAPYYNDQRSLDYYAKGYKQVIQELEAISDHRLNPDRLLEVCELSNKATELYLEIKELGRHVPNPVPYNLSGPSFGVQLMYQGTQTAVDFHQMMLEVSKERLKNGEHVLPEERIRLLIMYTGFFFDNTLGPWFAEEMGVTTFGAMLAHYDFNPLIDTSSVDSMLHDLAKRMLNLPMTRNLRGSWDMPANWLTDVLWAATNYNVDCMMFSGHTACKQTWGMYRLVADEVKKQLGIPSLRLEGDGWDPRITPISVIKEQLEDFFETLV